MPIPFHCPHCGAEADFPDESAGTNKPCPQCGQELTIPIETSSMPSIDQSLSRRFGCWGWLGILVIVLLVGLFIPPRSGAREAARRMVCMNNLKQLALAMHNYHDEYGQFPPAYVADADGRPMHSWRVLLLPYLDRKELYDKYNFDEPWDSPGNLALAEEEMPDRLCCPSDPEMKEKKNTNYMMVIGPGCISDGSSSISMNEVDRKTLASTILLVEVANSGVLWTEPVDLDAETMSYQINDPEKLGISSFHPGCAIVAFGDGSVKSLLDDTDPEEVRRMVHVEKKK